MLYKHNHELSQFQVCSDEPSAFTIDTYADNASQAGVDSGKTGAGTVAVGACLTEDYIQIEGR